MRKKVNRLTQDIASEILSSFALCSSVEDVKRVSERLMAKYGLMKDPFTGFPTPKAIKN